MSFVLWFWLFIGTNVVSSLLAKTPKDATPSGEGEFKVPTAEEGRVIPYLAGTCKISGPNVIWWGNLNTEPIEEGNGGLFGTGLLEKKYTIGYHYYAGMDMALCHGPVDSLIALYVGDKYCGHSQYLIEQPLSSGQEIYRRIECHLPDLFGGDKLEGGISSYSLSTFNASPRRAYDFNKEDRANWPQGGLCFYRGIPGQVGDFYLEMVYLEDYAGIDQHVPAYPGLCHMVLRLPYLGNSQYIKDWAPVVQRCPIPAGMDASKAQISYVGVSGNDANPAYVILDIMQSNEYGLGLPAGRFNITSFQDVANTLYSESFGISMLLDADSSADTVFSEICKTVDCVIFTDPSTGQWTIKLIRDDYAVGDLLEITKDDLLAEPEYSRSAWADTLNEVKIEFIDRANNFETRVVQAQETAHYAATGLLATETFSFKNVSNAAVASRIAARELKSHSYPVAQFRLVVNRKAWQLRPGSAFRLTWQPPTGPAWTDLVLRVTNIRYGALDEGRIEVDAVEDIFGISAAVYTDPGASGWVDPITAPKVVSAQRIEEAPYWMVGAERWAMAMAARGDTTTYAAEVWVDESLGYFYGNILDAMTPTGLLASSYSEKTAAIDETGFTIAIGAVDISRIADTDEAGVLRGRNLAMFADSGEIVSWEKFVFNSDGTATFSGVARGVLDTVPAFHSANTRVWFLTDGVCTTKPVSYQINTTVSAKILPKNARGTVAIGDATTITGPVQGRALKPYPPGNVKVNGLDYEHWPTTTVGENVTCTWSHRNRIDQGIGQDLVFQNSEAFYALEGDLTIGVAIYTTIVHSYEHETGTSKSYSAAQRIIDDPDGTKTVLFAMNPNNGLTGTMRSTPSFTMTGFGMTFGLYFGGIQG